MKKNNIVLVIVVVIIVLIGIILGSIYYLRNRRTYELNLPQIEEIESISVEQNVDVKVIKHYKDIKNILDIIKEIKRVTQQKSIQDIPINLENGMKIDFNLKKSEKATIFIYQKNNQYYIEQPYNGIYKISKNEYNSLLKYVEEKDIIDEDYYKNKLKELPMELSIQEAVSRGYFVYDGNNNKIYNKNVLDRFVKNTQINATNRVQDEMMMVIYTINDEPILYNILYNEQGYILVKDATRVKTTEIATMPKEYYEICVNSDIPKEYYSITVNKDTGINAVIISLTVYKNDIEGEQYKDIEIGRYLLNAEII